MNFLKSAALVQLMLLASVSAFTPISTRAPQTTTKLQSTSDKNLHKEVNRRDALSSFSTIFTTAAVASAATTIAPESAMAQGMPLFAKVDKLESANYIGQVGRPIYQPNVSGDPELYMPQVKVDGNNVEVFTKNKQSEEDYVQFIWLKDVKTNEVVLAKELTPADERPSLKAKVPSGVELRPYAFGKVHGLWKGEPFNVV